jgi:hypothetical protein
MGDYVVENILPINPNGGIGNKSIKINWSAVIYISIFVGLFAYAYFIKIPILCYGCDELTGFTGRFFRCVNETGNGTKSCKISTTFESTLSTGKETFKWGVETVKFIAGELSKVPENIRVWFNKLSVDIRNGFKYVVSITQDLYTFLKNGLVSFFRNAKTVVVNTFNQFTNFIKEIVVYITDFLTSIFKPIFDGISLLITNIVGEIGKFFAPTGQSFGDAIKSGIVNFIVAVPQTLVGMINFWIGNFVKGLNIALGPVDDVINSIRSFVNNNIIGTINGMINTLNSALNTFGVNLTPVKQLSGTTANISITAPVIPFDEDALRADLTAGIDSVISVVEPYISPIINIVVDIFSYVSGLAASIVTGVSLIFKKESWTNLFVSIKTQFDSGVVMPVNSFIKFVDEQIIKPAIQIFGNIKSSVIGWVQMAFNKVKTFFVDLKTTLQGKFNGLIENFTSVAGDIISTGTLGLYTYYATIIDQLIPLNISVTSKINIFVAICVFLFVAIVIVPLISNVTNPIMIKMFVILFVVLACIIVPSYIQTRNAEIIASYKAENFIEKSSQKTGLELVATL